MLSGGGHESRQNDRWNLDSFAFVRCHAPCRFERNCGEADALSFPLSLLRNLVKQFSVMANKKRNKKSRPFLIYSYTREEAIRDGNLIDVSDIAAKLGFRSPTVVTAAVWKNYCEPEDLPDEPPAILRDILWMLHCSLSGALPCRREETGAGEVVFFSFVSGLGTDKETLSELKAETGPGDEGESVITIMLTNES